MKEQTTRQRTCIVTGKFLPARQLMRFVADPAGVIVPDIAGTLPGRGVWLIPTQKNIGCALAKNLFARRLKSPVQNNPELSEMVEGLLIKLILGTLGFARKAGMLVSGYVKVEATIRSGEAHCVLHAMDGKEEGIRKLGCVIRSMGQEFDWIRQYLLLTSIQLQQVIKKDNIRHIAVKKSGIAKKLEDRLQALQVYRCGV